MRLLIDDLRRRKPFKVGVGYGMMATALLVAGDFALPAMGAPAWAFNLIVAALFITFPFVVILTWALTAEPPEGLRARTRAAPRLGAATGTTGGLKGRATDA